MAQIEKYTLQQAKAICAHHERTGAFHSNENIDPEMTKYNYAVWPDPPDRVGEKNAWKRLTKRLSEVERLHRKDVNVLCNWTIHLGVDVPPGLDDEEDFFRAAFNYCKALYGEENIVYAHVHVDEDIPHLNVGFVPVVRKKRKLRKNASEELKALYEAQEAAGANLIEKVDANSLINRKHLKSWHSGFSAYMIDALGYDPAVYTGITKAMGGNMTVKQLKAKPKAWREQRNKKAEAFHAQRRAAKGERLSADERILVAEQSKTPPPQADFGSANDEQKPKKSIGDLIAWGKKRQEER